MTALMASAEYGHTHIVELLLQNGAEIDEKNNSGFTALHWAAEEGRKDVVELLIQNNAKQNIVQSRGICTILPAESLPKPPKIKEAHSAKPVYNNIV